MPAIVYRIDYRPPGWERFREGIDELVTCDRYSETPEEVADMYRCFDGHRWGPGEFRAVRED